MIEIKPGDLVRLKSGGPKMTVERVAPEAGNGGEAGEVACCFFSKRQLVREKFQGAAVKRVGKGANQKSQ